MVALEQNADAAVVAADRSWDGSTTSKDTWPSRPGKRRQGDTREELSRQRREAWEPLVLAVADLDKLGIDQGTAEQAVRELSGSLKPDLAGFSGDQILQAAERALTPFRAAQPTTPIPASTITATTSPEASVPPPASTTPALPSLPAPGGAGN